MADHVPDDSAGAQLAMLVAIKLLLTRYRGNPQAVQSLDIELEAMRANLLASAASDRKVVAFDTTAKSLREVVEPKGPTRL